MFLIYQVNILAQDLLANLAGLYYQNLSAALKNPNDFQVATGSVQVQDQTTVDLISGAIPIESLNNSFSGNPVNTFDGNYSNVINELVAPSYVQVALGTQYEASWETFKAANAAELVFTPADKYLESLQLLMRKWGAVDSIPTGTVGAGVNALAEEMDSSTFTATTLWQSNNGNPYGYVPQYPSIAIEFNNPQSCSFEISNIQNSADLSNTWASGEFSVLADIFEFGNETSYSDESKKFIGSSFVLKFSCRQVSLDVSAIGVGQDFSVATTKYGAWYLPAALQRGYTSPNDATVWARSADWSKYFGDNGTFSRVITKLFLGDDINLTMSSTATFSSEEVTKIQTASEGGFWPFFIGKGEGGSTSTVIHNDDSTITVTSTSPIGVPILLGVATCSVKDLFKGEVGHG